MKAIYARQSVDRVDSISIESQIEFCKYELRGEPFKLYVDKGYSGKNTDRPRFQEMLADIKSGEITQVIVYKLDRISRSILDFSNMMELFQKYHVEFVSSTEKFDTSSPMGRAMLNICIVFAQLERETIQKRVSDAYYSRSKKGFYMGGRIPYGYGLSDTVIEGVRTSQYAIKQDEADQIKLIYSLYSQPGMSLGDVVRYLNEHNIENKRDRLWDRSKLSALIKNPIYVRADQSIYQFYQSNGAILINDPSDFVGTNGCYLYTGKGAESKRLQLKGQNVVLAPHEGIVDSDTWIKARLKCLGNQQATKPTKAANTWLAGKIKCGKCGYALTISKSKSKAGRYFYCTRKVQTFGCEGAGTIRADDFEQLIFGLMKEKLVDFKELSKSPSSVADPKMSELKIQYSQIEAEIATLLDKIAMADSVLMDYIGKRVSELDARKKEIEQEIQDLSSKEKMPDIKTIQNYLRKWEEVSFDDKRTVVDALIKKICATEDAVEIEWRL